MNGSAAGASVGLTVNGSDTNIPLNVTPKRTGMLVAFGGGIYVPGSYFQTASTTEIELSGTVTKMANLPTTNPGVTGQLWNNAGVLTVAYCPATGYRDWMEKRLGIAVVTYNRKDLAAGLCSAIRLLTEAPFDLVVCDDGSTDGTPETLKALGETVISGRNGGVARNKNRGLWFLLYRLHVDAILLLEDDVIPTRQGWESDWLTAIDRVGHVNFMAPFARDAIEKGACTGEDPGLSRHLTGQAMGFRRDVLASVGFMDPRFRKYGHGHADLTCRAIRAGFGGVLGQPENRFWVIEGNLKVLHAPSHGTPEDIKETAALWGNIAHEQIYRHAWRDDAERAEFLAETKPL